MCLRTKSALLLVLVIGLLALTDTSSAADPIGAPSRWSWDQKQIAKDLMQEQMDANLADFFDE
uniref:Uncharacterized protein n=1 Tax=Ciona intestinalis TaxID=7719 RepID=F6WRT9_CIOIN